MATDQAGTVADAVAARAHALSANEVARSVDVDPAVGLSAAEVVRRAAAFGPNELEEAPRTSVARLFWDALTEPFVILLIVAGVLAVALGEVRDGLLVLLALLPIVGADVVTGYRGEKALDALRAASAPTARVRRDGGVDDVSAAGVVVGDVVLLRAGDVVPADLRLLRADRLIVDRSVLTGESVPEPAGLAADPADAPLTDRRSMAYAGTSIVGGRGEGVVVAIGGATEVGRIASGLGVTEEHRSPLQRELDRLVRILLVVAIGLIAIVTGLGFARGQDAGANLLAGISAAIAAIPEEPPILLAVILGLGAYRLLRRDVLVRRLNAEETLGAVDLIITDKTGTLTRNRLDVVSVRDIAGSLDGQGRLDVLREGLRAEDDAWVRAEGMAPGSFTSSLARSIEAAGADASLRLEDLVSSEPVTDGRPISLTRSHGPSGIEDLAIGAPEAILALADPAREETAAWLALVEAGAAAGERLVAVARRALDDRWHLRALIGFADPLRDGIRDALETARVAGIEVIVVTGDHPLTAGAIAAAAGLDASGIVVGEEIAAWDDERLTAELPRLRIVARSTPDQKERLVRLARAAGRTVVVTGDGVNDAPALHRADVAVAMGSGTGVAKEAADLVLGDDSFATLMYGLAEGRRIVDNVEKGLVFLISTHVALLGFILIATLYGFGQPLLPLQILWLELFIDLSTSVAFELEKPEPDLMQRPPRRRDVPLLTNELLGRISVAGGFSAVAALVVMVTHPGTADHTRWLAYTVLVCAQAVRANANRSLRIPIHRLPPNWFLLAAGLIVIGVQVAIPQIPLLAEAFRATPLDASDWLLVAVIALAPAVLAEVVRTVTGRTWIA
ncbi:MAG: cation-translocating P-type ATPase [Chloroflexota bacterium]